MKRKKKYRSPELTVIILDMESSVAADSAITLHTEGSDGGVKIADWKTEEQPYDEWF